MFRKEKPTGYCQKNINQSAAKPTFLQEMSGIFLLDKLSGKRYTYAMIAARFIIAVRLLKSEFSLYLFTNKTENPTFKSGTVAPIGADAG